MQDLAAIKVGTLHPDGTVTEPANLTWTQMDQEHLVSQKLHNGDWAYHLVIHITDLKHACGEEGFMAQVVAVSAEAAGEENVKTALEGCGLEDTSKLGEQAVAVILCDDGCSAPLWFQTEPTERAVVKMAKPEAERINMLFGMYMDKPMNRIGSTGWDFIRGNVMAGLDKAL